MDNKKARALIFLMNCLPSYDNRSIDDIIDHALNYNEEMETVSGKMNIEILRLLDEGYTEDEIYDMIDGLLPEGIDKLSEEQKLIVRDDTKKLILKRKENMNYE